ncbi:MAG: zinc transporter ZupT [Pseudomonadota bacterium]
MSNVALALGLTLLAGLATTIGSFLAFFVKSTNRKFLSLALGFSAGVMIYVSFVEIFFKAKDSLVASLGITSGTWLTVASFFGGIFLIGLIDKLIPSYENPHEIHQAEEIEDSHAKTHFRKLHRVGLMVALAIAIHNFPEGLATFMAALENPYLGVSIAVAIAIHNIPEGMSISIPIYYATNNKKKAFWYSSLSGLAEPLGAIIGYLIIRPFMNGLVFGITFAMVGGIMVFISLDELLPAAREYGEHHLSIYGLIAGMMVMALSLLLFI